MEKFVLETGVAAPYLSHNVDTDVIMPKQFLKRIDRAGLAEGVLFDQRFLNSGAPNPEFILNQPSWSQSRFLVVGDNFGCGSSREYAVWGIQQLGIKAIIGTSFAGIFYDNCQRNGVLLISLTSAERDLLGEIVSHPETNELVIDLESQTIKAQTDIEIDFDIDPLKKEALIKGLDTIGSTLEKQQLIKDFEGQHLAANPWLR
ncbi:3-isopropylmalate dehydratase small subunit [Photobacterium rosenbergii]|uniref:3-isopropylmalate dehydratase small subunit n=1 Tax=Photobacterium rosenbergii TaxID=294936 RepID=UPI001C98E903|nr:3-isopropylmalate dehydratase small subunit [Photobacterium rosenbergii]MBY5944686.1 3-isopropylmalate dehydratase small subunit [Photobacterium rosenbergii]